MLGKKITDCRYPRKVRKITGCRHRMARNLYQLVLRVFQRTFPCYGCSWFQLNRTKDSGTSSNWCSGHNLVLGWHCCFGDCLELGLRIDFEIDTGSDFDLGSDLYFDPC